METIIGFSNDVTGRTGDVTGTGTVAGSKVSSATFQVSLAAITVDGKTRQPQLLNSPRLCVRFPALTDRCQGRLPLTACWSRTGGRAVHV